MINFRQKNYGVKSVVKTAIDKAKKNPLGVANLGIGTTGLAVSSANLVNNRKNRVEGSKERQEQIQVMKHLNNTLANVDDKLLIEKKPENKKEEPILNITPFFRSKKKKTFSYASDYALKGLGIGGLISTAPLALTKGGKSNPFGKVGEKVGLRDIQPYSGGRGSDGKPFTDQYDKYREDKKDTINKNKVLLVGGTMIVGAALGALIGGIRDLISFGQKKNVSYNQLSKKIVENLISMGFKKEKDFTLNPKTADQLKLKICISISKTNGDVKLVINTVNDRNLHQITSNIIKNLPQSAIATENTGDRFNNLIITKLSSVEDPAFVTGILEQFIRRGYPVYIVEVG